jgi:chromosome segregation ATPase
MYTGKEVLNGKNRAISCTVHRRNTSMKPSAGKRLKTADIAEITGLPEEEIRDIAQRHGNRIPSQKMGRIQIYDEKAAGIFAAIADEEGKEKTDSIRNTEERNKEAVKEKEKNGATSRLSSISETRDKEEKTAKTTAGGAGPSGRVPTQLINTIAMQGQQFSRFADRLTAVEDAATADREAFNERIERLERQVAALQEQMEAVDSWIEHVDRRLDTGDARMKQLAEETHTWTNYVRDELAFLRLSWWERRQQK